MPEWTAGAVTVPLDPGPGHAIGGYAARVGASTAPAHGSPPLEATVVVVQGPEGDPFAWVALDAIAVSETLAGRLAAAVSEATGVPAERVVSVASHTHSGPVGWVGTIHPVLPATLDEALVDDLVTRVAQGARLLDIRPATIAVATGHVAGVGVNRHDPDGPADDRVTLLEIRSGADVVAFVVAYACHPTVLGPDNTQWSADWVHGLRVRLRERTGARVPVALLQGAAGDVSPRFHRRSRTIGEADRLGALVADAALEARPGAGTLEPRAVDLDRRTVTVPVKARALATPAPATVAGTAPDAGGERLAQSLLEAAEARDALASTGLPAAIDLRITRVRLGHTEWLHLPVELFSAFGLALSSLNPDLRVIGYSDGYAGYVATSEAHAAGHYEAQASFFDVEATERLVEGCRDYVLSRYETSRS